MNVGKLIQESILSALDRCGISGEQALLELPKEFANGDYSSSVALQFAKQLELPPRELAEKLKDLIGEIDGVEKIEIAGPGFINFYLAPPALGESVSRAISEDMWGANALFAKEQILLEYTSPNLFKPLHIGNLVGNILGESISRLLQFSGADVKRINYPSDIGLTVAKGVWGLKKLGADPNDIGALGEAYRVGNAAYEDDAAAKPEIDIINKKLYEDSDPELTKLRKSGIETSRKHLDNLCRKLGTTFDYELFESEAGPIGRDVVLAHPDTFPESDGARVFIGEEHGLHTRVFVTSAGLPTYEAKDLGNFVLKTKKYPDWTQYFVVTGAEQKDYFKVLLVAIKQVFPEVGQKVLSHVANGFLTPTTGKMSSRKGNVITGESLIGDLIEAAKERAADSRADDKGVLAEQVAIAALKYQILKQGAGKDIIFDRERALSIEGDSGPYVQYAHARAHQICEKARSEGVSALYDETAAASEVARLIHRFPEVVEYAAKLYEPHIVTNYLISLASCFNSWYAQEQILDGTTGAAHKVAITDAVRKTLKNGLWILGIPTPERM